MRRLRKMDGGESARKITRRALMLGGAQAAVVTGMALRMRYMQVVEADKYRMLADENRINIRLIPPARGLIFDRNGILLAGNEQNYSVVVVREDAGDVRGVLTKLAELIPLSADDIDKAVKEAHNRSPFVPITVSDRLSWDDLSRVAVNTPALPGISPQVGLSRHYPLDRDLAHVVGYVGPVSERDLKRIADPDPVLQIPRFQIGKVGVEAKMEDVLRGKAGTKRVEVNAVGRVMRELDRTPSTPGANVQLTIDAALQDFALARLGSESAATVVMDIRNGDLLAMASSPSYDPNLFVRGISTADYDKLLQNDHRPLANKTVQGTYPPGSTFKPVTGLAALHAGDVDPDEKIMCRGFIEVGGRRFHCWKHSGHGEVDLRQALTQSCDVYFYTIAQRVGIDAISAMAGKMGLGTRYDLPLSAIAEGLNPTKAWKRKYRHADWLIGDTINAAIGQGFVLSSPLQLAVLASRLASGRSVMPRLIQSIDGIDQPVEPAAKLDFKDSSIDGVREGMFGVVNGRHGTARGARIDNDQMLMAGKTGTSQVRTITPAERAKGITRNEDLPWKFRDHALFICFAPFDDPRYAVSVIVEHGGGGSSAAAPIARDVMLRALYGQMPPLEAYPRYQRGQIKDLQDTLQLRHFAPEPPARSRA